MKTIDQVIDELVLDHINEKVTFVYHEGDHVARVFTPEGGPSFYNVMIVSHDINVYFSEYDNLLRFIAVNLGYVKGLHVFESKEN